MIGDCLDSIRSACGSLPHEVIVVADTCTDGTAPLARAAGARVLEVRHRQISATRHSGALAAQGEVLFFLDADTQTRPEVVGEALKALENPDLVGGGASFTFAPPVPWWTPGLERLLWLICWILQLAGGCGLFCRREVYFQVGGFDRSLYAAEEIVFCKALKRVGKFRLLRERVQTSGRKLRLYRPRELARMVWAYLRRGDGLLQDRQALHLWYERREEKG